jgi:hypothetical protein
MFEYIVYTINRFYDILRYFGVISPPFTFEKVELLSATFNDTIDITENVIDFFRYYDDDDYHVSVCDILSNEQQRTFENVEFCVLINHCMFDFTHTELGDILYFQYGLEWPKHVNKSDVLGCLGYLDLAMFKSKSD